MIDDIKDKKDFTGLKIYQIIKTFVYIALAISILFLKEMWLEHHRYLIGGLMLVYGLEAVIICIIQKEFLKFHFYQGLIETFLGLVTVFWVSDFTTICVMWGVWSIMRESGEIQDAVEKLITKHQGFISLALSIIVIIFSAKIIIEPTEETVLAHFTLLAIELTVTVLGIYADNLYIYVISKKDNLWKRISQRHRKNHEAISEEED